MPDNGLNTSDLGVEVYPQGQHPRDLRKEGKNVAPTLKGAYQAWLKEQDERVQRIAERNPEKGVSLFQSYVAGLAPADMAKAAGVDATSDVEDESQAANVSPNAKSAGEKKKAAVAKAKKEEKPSDEPSAPANEEK